MRLNLSLLLCLVHPSLLALPAGVPTPTHVAQNAPAGTLTANGSFEMPSTFTQQYRPTLAGWSFTGSSGICKEKVGNAAYNDVFPSSQGDFAAFIQNTGRLEHTVTVAAGIYRLRFRAAQSRNADGSLDTKIVRVSLNGLKVMEEAPQGAGFENYVSRPVRVTGTTCTVVIEGTATGADATLLDSVTLEPVSDWSSPSTWSGGVVPGASSHVHLPASSRVALSGNSAARTLLAEGSLLCLPVDVELRAKWLLVYGEGSLFEVGTPGAPFPARFDLVLTGTKADADAGIDVLDDGGTKFLMAMDQGWIDLHGAPKTSWTRLNATAAAGSTVIQVRGTGLGWSAGDDLVIASTDVPAPDASGLGCAGMEKRRIQQITESGGVSTITLGSALSFKHLGVTRTFTRSSPARTWKLEQAAEVGLLTHNVRVRGEISSGTGESTFGGHIMLMNCAACGLSGYGRFSNVELWRMGQKQQLGRYPMHWHMQAEQGEGQFLHDSSIHETFNRAVVIHGSWGVSVERNVAYDHAGHGIILEDGSEQDNRIISNLVMQTRRPAAGEELTPSDNSHDQVQNRSPAGFWITNPANVMEGNVAAGTLGTGFWFIFPDVPLGLSASHDTLKLLRPREAALGSFSGNMAHSCMNGFDVNDRLSATHTIIPNVPWLPPAEERIEQFSAYACDIAIYSGQGGWDKLRYEACALADNLTHVRLAARQLIHESVLVADSDTSTGDLLNGAFRRALQIYDGPAVFQDCHFIGFDNANAPLVNSGGASNKFMDNVFSGVTRSGGALYVKSLNYSSSNVSALDYGFTLLDLDGSLSGTAGTRLIPNHRMMTLSGESAHASPNVQLTQREFAYFRLYYVTSSGDIASENQPDITWTRHRGAVNDVHLDTNKVNPHLGLFEINRVADVTHSVSWTSLPTSVNAVRVRMQNLLDGDHLIACLRGFAAGRTITMPGGWLQSTSFSQLSQQNQAAWWKDATTGDLWLHIYGDSSDVERMEFTVSR